jgi:hypothetical protein
MTVPMTLRPDHGAAPRQTNLRRIACLMGAVAFTLGIASALHLSGSVPGRSEPFDATHAGVAEAVIGMVLAGGAVAVVRFRSNARAIALGAVAFATVGFGVGLTFTVRGGDLPDVLYHVVILPLLIGSLIVLMRTRGSARNDDPS